MDTKLLSSSGKRRPPNAGKGRQAGVPNKSTTHAREAIALLVETNAPRMMEWLESIRQEEGPLVAWKCMADVMEYHLPKLARTELVGDKDKPLLPTNWVIVPVKSSE